MIDSRGQPGPAAVKVAWIALGLGTLVLVAWLVLRPSATTGLAGEGRETAAVLASLERLERAQARQDARLAALERRIAPMSTASAARPAGGGATRPGRAGTIDNGRPPHPVKAEADRQVQLRTLEDRLVSEPLSQAWAAQQERAVAMFLAPASLAREGLPAPRASDTRCQSSLCRIRLRFDDEAVAGAAQIGLLQAIAPTLPHAQSFLVPQPDGSTELLVFAAADGRSLR